MFDKLLERCGRTTTEVTKVTYEKTVIIRNGKVLKNTSVLNDGGACATEEEVRKLRQKLDKALDEPEEIAKMLEEACRRLFGDR